ncbi:MAG: glycyl-tRNA synthetase [archaeon GW2011_AR5]|nr:MAG: glycyl-tRNA synthetase [archaeon GW2011_AR5]
MTSNFEKIEEIARRRGFFWIGSEVYGGLSGFYDYAHLGSLLKSRWESEWRKFFLGLDDNFFEIQPAEIMHERVWQASGHVESFVDPVVKCRKCGNVERADKLLEEQLKESFEGISMEELAKVIKKHNMKCPKCKGQLEEVGVLNLMFPITIGNDVRAYLRGETAQAAYLNFRREFETLRKRLPLGLAIIGKAFRNEISPRQLITRMREFTQAELQIFFDPEKMEEHRKFGEVKDYKILVMPVKNRENNQIDEVSCEEMTKHLPRFYVYHMAKVQQFFLDVLGIPRHLFRFKELSDEEKAFYNKYHWDIEVKLESIGGFLEIGGVHYRTDHDLGAHQKISKQDMSVFADGRKFVPHVLELSFGVDRNIYAQLELCYKEDRERSFFNFPRRLAPFDCGLFPLVNKDGIDGKAEELKAFMKDCGFSVFYDDSGSIGRRYRRMDEIGVPASITVDHRTLEDRTVTIRDRDSMKQIRIPVADMAETLRKFISGTPIESLGTPVK